MIICPTCQAHMPPAVNQTMSCICGSQFKQIDNIWFFEKDYEESFEDHTACAIDQLAKNVNHHFWFLARKRWVNSFVCKLLKPGDNFLDVGTGGCDIAVEARNNGLEVTLSDIQVESLQRGNTLGFKNLVQFDLYKPIFADHFHGVGAFDVIEHLDDDNAAVSNLIKMTAPGGYLFLTVPAFHTLWNNRDVMERHKRRYDKKSLEQLFKGKDVEILVHRYIFFSIFPLLVLRALTSRIVPKKIFSSQDYAKQFAINRWINKFLDRVLMFEKTLFSNKGAPFGGSLLIIAKKSNS